VVKRAEQQDSVGTAISYRQVPRVAGRDAGQRSAGLPGCRCRLLDVQWHRVDQVHLVASRGQRYRVGPGTAADIHHRRGDCRQAAFQQVPYPRELDPLAAGRQPVTLQAVLVVSEDLRINHAEHDQDSRAHPATGFPGPRSRGDQQIDRFPAEVVSVPHVGRLSR
jgi:hypothetical protein